MVDLYKQNFHSCSCYCVHKFVCCPLNLAKDLCKLFTRAICGRPLFSFIFVAVVWMSLLIQNTLVALCAVVMALMFELDWNVCQHLVLFAGLTPLVIIFGSGANLATVANTISIEKDWVVVLADKNENTLAGEHKEWPSSCFTLCSHYLVSQSDSLIVAMCCFPIVCSILSSHYCHSIKTILLLMVYCSILSSHYQSSLTWLY